jgi:hypothetical protein
MDIPFPTLTQLIWVYALSTVSTAIVRQPHAIRSLCPYLLLQLTTLHLLRAGVALARVTCKACAPSVAAMGRSSYQSYTHNREFRVLLFYTI